MVQNILSSLGGGSGIDTKALVESLVAAERAPRDAILDSRTQTFDTQISGYGALRSSMTGIQDSIKLLADADTFNARNVSFADTRLVSPTKVDAGSVTGNYSVNVTALAAAHSLSAGGFSDIDAVVGSGTLNFSFGDWAADHLSFTTNADKAAKSLTIDASNNTLSGIRDAINEGDFGAQASIINVGGTYTLQITAESGANNELQIAVTEAVPAGLSQLAYEVGTLTLAEGVSGADSAFSVNGLAITRSSNVIDDVIDGLSFTLNTLSANASDSTNIGVEADSSYGEQIVRDFVEAYNLFLEQVSSLTTAIELDDDAEDLTPGSLARDFSAKSMVSEIRSLISSTINGIGGDYTALATIGIKTELSGEISINETQFKSVLENNFSALTDLLTGKNSSSDTRVDVVKTSSTTATGSVEVVVTTDPAKGGWVASNAITEPSYQPLSDDFSTPLLADASYSFKVSVDGTTSDLLTLSGSFSTAAELQAGLQSLINGDANLSAVGAAVDVSFDTGSDTFSLTSRAWGATSGVSITESGAGMVGLGIDKDNGTTTAGVDVAGTLNGVAAFGSGNVLLPVLGSALTGLSLQISPGVTSATITLSRGFANEVNNILDNFLKNNGLIDTREQRISDQKLDIATDRETLDGRMEARLAVLQNQFLAMERIIRSLNSTSDSLTGLVDRLPFTATN